ncbi:MAG: rRNA maturation RNase YbeY [Phycisphaerae bacterium]|jgi:probable rRNA maturation factor
MSPVKQTRNIAVRIAENFKDIKIRLPKLKKLVKAVCNRFKLSKATISIAIVSNTQIRKLNKQFLNKNRPTDCLSFDLSDNDTNSLHGKRSRTIELIVNGEMAVKKATQQGHSAEAELALYITHGLLHNLGFDDSTKKQAEKMHNTEDEILQRLGYGRVYNKPKIEK